MNNISETAFMQGISQRLKEYALDHYKNITAFEKASDLYCGFLCKGAHKMSIITLIKILKNNPALDIKWLLTGEVADIILPTDSPAEDVINQRIETPRERLIFLCKVLANGRFMEFSKMIPDIAYTNLSLMMRGTRVIGVKIGDKISQALNINNRWFYLGEGFSGNKAVDSLLLKIKGNNFEDKEKYEQRLKMLQDEVDRLKKVLDRIL